jgi:hypothetical protein
MKAESQRTEGEGQQNEKRSIRTFYEIHCNRHTVI